MIIIVDKGELSGRVGELARQLPLEDIDPLEVVDNDKVSSRSLHMANIFIVTDYNTNRLRVIKHRFNEHLHGAILPLSELYRAIEDEVVFGVLRC